MNDPRITYDPKPPEGFCDPGACSGPRLCYRCRQECERRGDAKMLSSSEREQAGYALLRAMCDGINKMVK